jgi:hypothetical protein
MPSWVETHFMIVAADDHQIVCLFIQKERCDVESATMRNGKPPVQLKPRVAADVVSMFNRTRCLLSAKADFARRRARMRASLLARYPLLFKDLFAGRYALHAQGWRSALMDAVL